MEVDILVIAAHPDDAEMGCGGTIISHVKKGYKVGLIDLTEGELGTRGTPKTRKKEAGKAAEIMGINFRENLHFQDGFFQNNPEHQFPLIQRIRRYRPRLILTNASYDRHPDHIKASELVEAASFYSGLRRIETRDNGKKQKTWRPRIVYHFIQYYYIQPELLVDIKPYLNKKLQAIKAFESQFYNPESDEPETILTNPQFLQVLKSRWRELGSVGHLDYAEGFVSKRKIAVDDLFSLKYDGIP